MPAGDHWGHEAWPQGAGGGGGRLPGVGGRLVMFFKIVVAFFHKIEYRPDYLR